MTLELWELRGSTEEHQSRQIQQNQSDVDLRCSASRWRHWSRRM